MSKNFAGSLLSRVVNKPLLATPEIAKYYVGYLAQRDSFDGVLIDAGAQVALGDLTAAGKYDYREGKKFPTVAGTGMAVIEIYGSLTHKLGSVAPYSGMTGYDGIERQLDEALADPAVRGIMLDIHSHGGEVSGCFDLADRIHAAARVKPVWAIADESCYSAAYCLGSQANRLITPRTGGVGSVGVVMMHLDYSKALEKEGLTVTFIHAGAHKVDGNPFQPLPDEIRAEWQAEVESSYRMFTAIVARGNGIAEADVIATQARCFAAEDALTIGFVDAIQSATDTFDEFADYLRSARTIYPAASAATSSKETAMSQRQGAASLSPRAEDCPPCECEDMTSSDAGTAAAAFATKNPAGAEHLRAAGAAAERERISNIQALAEPGEEELAAKFVAEGLDTGKAALAFAASRKQQREAAAAARRADTPAPIPQAPVDASAGQGEDKRSAAELSDEELKGRYAKSAALQEEFGSADRYVAYVRAESAGRVNLKTSRALGS